ncbi:MAG: hypothetical protein N2746_02685 [Deltaproteobacteria bacterium]|nr:hypothetical protein [Deltaproteobacteria bacterium]
MTCLEFKEAVKDYIAGRLPEDLKTEFKEHLLSCNFCRRDMGEHIAAIISGEQDSDKKDKNRRYLFFIAFITFIILTTVVIQFTKIKEYNLGEIKPISEPIKERLSEQQRIKKQLLESKSAMDPDNNKPNEIDRENSEVEVEDFSSYSIAELKSKLISCKEKGDHRCIAKAALFAAKQSIEEERRRFRMMAIESLVEIADCSTAMLQIMLLLKENPPTDDAMRAHLLNAMCYVKEKNFRDAERILSMLERDAPKLRAEITKIREEIKKGVGDGRQTKSKGIQDRDSP